MPLAADPRPSEYSTSSSRAVRTSVRNFGRPAILFFFVTLSTLALLSARLVGDDSLTFETHIAPIFQARCVKCHGDGKIEAGLDLRRKFTLVKGGDSGPAIVAGQADESLLFQKIESGEMPPPEEGRLDATQRTLIRRWIAAGAPLANATELPLDEADQPSRLTAEDREFWAFQRPIAKSPPPIAHSDRAKNPIDAFLLNRLEAKQLTFNGETSKSNLLRRLTLDLHGLPPDEDQRVEFLADNGPDADVRLVDRLLASPRYGERWGRHWLDVAGYADSDGYLAADRLRPEAWRYRDYVIQAHNSDLPYDRFIAEQLAGDELSDWRQGDDLAPEITRQLAATGFLRTASDPTYPGYTEPNEIYQVLADTMQIVGSSFMGLTVQCCRCHAHKFDPLSLRDYYSLQAVFLPALDPARWQPSEVRGIPLATDAELARVNQLNQKVDGRINELNASLIELTARHRRKLLAERLPSGALPADAAAVEKLSLAVFTPVGKRNDEQKMLVAQLPIPLALSDADVETRFPDFKTEVQNLKGAIAAETALRKKTVLVRGIVDLDEKGILGRVLKRGDYGKPGAEVPPGVPEVFGSVNATFAPQPGPKTTGRRAALARWLTDPANPLTARVQVNRMWAHHFGRGIVATPANFGRSGARPSHPELLDWLAQEFQSSASADAEPQTAGNWSAKRLHRLMLTSSAYQQSSDTDPLKQAADPENILLGAWQPRRVEGEVLRDGVLAAAGKLNSQLAGSPSPVTLQGDGSVITNDDAAGSRRSVYLIVRRSQHLTMFDLFDTPMMEVNCPERNVSTVPLQALALLHGPFAERSAAALADRILESSADDSARVTDLFQRLFTRAPIETERLAVQEFLAAAIREQWGDSPINPTDPKSIAAVRTAWTQIALVLVNSNEFVYVH